MWKGRLRPRGGRGVLALAAVTVKAGDDHICQFYYGTDSHMVLGCSLRHGSG